MGDQFFDLAANFAISHELDADGRAVLLAAYAGDAPPAAREALDLMRFMSDFREAMWGVVQNVVSELEFDFDGYAAEHFERMERTAAQPSLERGWGLKNRGACAAPLALGQRIRSGAGFRRRLEPRALLLLEQLELVLGAHADRALEPFARRQQPPAAEGEADPGEPEDRVVRELPAEVVAERHADVVQREDEQDRDDPDPHDGDGVEPLVVTPEAQALGSSHASPSRQRSQTGRMNAMYKPITAIAVPTA